MSRVEPNPNDPNFVANYIKALEARVGRLEQSALRGLGGLANPEGWHFISAPGELPFATGWFNNPAVISPPRYFVDGSGFVHLAGLPSYGGGGSSIVFTLPTDLPWLYVHQFQTSDGVGTPYNLVVDTNGNVRITPDVGTLGAPPNGVYSLDGALVRTV